MKITSNKNQTYFFVAVKMLYVKPWCIVAAAVLIFVIFFSFLFSADLIYVAFRVSSTPLSHVTGVVLNYNFNIVTAGLEIEGQHTEKEQANLLKRLTFVPTVMVCWGPVGVHDVSESDEYWWREVTFFCCPPWHATSLSSDQSFAMNWRLAMNPSGRGR